MSSQMTNGFLSSFSIVAIVLNLCLLPLIAFRSGREIGSYKVLLFLYTLVAIMYTSSAVIIVPVFETSEKGWLLYSAVHRFPQELGSYIICFFSACYIKLLMIITYSFLYRYCVMCSQKHLDWFRRPPRIALLILIYVAVIAFILIPVLLHMRMNKEIADRFRGNLEIDLEHSSYLGAAVYRDGRIVLETAGVLLSWTIVIVTASSICTYCIFKIMMAFQSLSTLSQFNSKSRKVQYRLFLLLVLQTLSPLIFSFIPALLTYSFAYLQIHEPIVMNATSAILPVAQIIDPILIFCVISEYRRSVLYVFRKVIGISMRASQVYDISSTHGITSTQGTQNSELHQIPHDHT